ncbi:MAG: hypothetical protein ACJA0Q_000258 [Saprospiraceae bacterium]|jgi:hypothetical protein
MKKQMRVLGTMLVAVSLMLASCEKEELETIEETTEVTIEETTDLTTEETTMEETNGETVEGTEHNEPIGQAFMVEGELVFVNGEFGVHMDGRCYILDRNDRRRLRELVGKCVRIKIVRVGCNDRVYKVVKISPCCKGGHKDEVKKDRIGKELRLVGHIHDMNGAIALFDGKDFYELRGRDGIHIDRFVGRHVTVIIVLVAVSPNVYEVHDIVDHMD